VRLVTAGGAGEPAQALPDRPALITPPHLQTRRTLARERALVARQPWLGAAGLLVLSPFFFLLALSAGGPQASLEVLGPLSTFALPVVAMIALWWEDWPGSSLRSGWSGLVDTAFSVGAAVLLTGLGQVVVGRLDLQGIFRAEPGPGHLATFPATVPLGAAAFSTMLQLTLVFEGWPLRGLGRFRAGLLALVISWAVAVASYLLVINLDALPPGVRAATGLRNPGGPVAAGEFGALLVAIGAWQSVLFIALRGWPIRDLRPRWVRLLVGNLVVIVGGWLTYALLHHLAHIEPSTITAAGGTVVATALVVAILFEGWPAWSMRPRVGRALTLAVVAVGGYALDRGLAAYAEAAEDRTRATVNDWVALAALNFIGGLIILHVAIWRRWPLLNKRERDASGG
jgi:hypothetical protein